MKRAASTSAGRLAPAAAVHQSAVFRTSTSLIDQQWFDYAHHDKMGV
jgi:hypothetical protein